MLPVSANWQQAIKEQFRYQGYLKVLLQVAPPGLQEGLQVNTPDTDSNSDVGSMYDSNDVVTPFATLESNRWLLNGQFDLLTDDTVVDDWWSTPMTDKASKLLTFEFDKTYNIPGIYVVWDPVNGTFPSRVVITGYDAEGASLGTSTVVDVTSSSGFVEVPFDGVKTVTMQIDEWSVSLWRARIAEILFGLYASYDSINNGRIASAESLDSSSPISDELPKHTIKASLRNEDKQLDPTLQSGVSKYLARRQRMIYQWGFTTSRGVVEWSPPLVYYIDSFSIPEDSKEASISATSKLAFLDEEYKLSPYSGTRRTLYDVATEVLRASSIIREGDSVDPWQLSETLKEFYTNAPVPNKAVNSILQLIAGAATCWLHTDFVTGNVAITDFKVDDAGQQHTEVTQAQELGDPAYSVQEQLLSLSIGVYSYTKSTQKTELSKNEYKISGETVLNISYNVSVAMEVTCAVEGATLVSFVPFGSSCTVTVKPSSGSTAAATITVSGYEVKQAVTYVETYRDASITHGLAIRLDNPFITETDSLERLSDWIVSWYQRRQKIKVPYIGYPEVTVGDTVSLSTIYGSSDVSVCSASLDFNGGFNGQLEVW